MIATDTWKKIDQITSSVQKVVVTSHASPDGDAIGSALGLFHILKTAGKDVKVALPDPFAPFFNWMPEREQVYFFDQQAELVKDLLANADLVFCLDYNSLNRVGKMEEALRNSKRRILIDHHPEPAIDQFEVCFSDVLYSSTCEMVADWALNGEYGKSISQDAATCLYTGIVTDSGSFRFPTTSSRTHRIAADLIDRGAKNSAIHSLIYDNNTEGRLRLTGYALQEMRLLKDLKTAVFVISMKELNRFGYRKGDTEGLVNYGLSIAEVQLSVLLLEREDGVKFSFRSKGNIPANKIAAEHFGGGGHKNAAGGFFAGSLADAESELMKYLPALIND